MFNVDAVRPISVCIHPLGSKLLYAIARNCTRLNRAIVSLGLGLGIFALVLFGLLETASVTYAFACGVSVDILEEGVGKNQSLNIIRTRPRNPLEAPTICLYPMACLQRIELQP